ncbi:MAG: hypothetical protein GXP50_14065 [Deltaproteobacteria bacterium]|nr:hypothetical protein [Deltaproteobacteria bacterium]
MTRRDKRKQPPPAAKAYVKKLDFARKIHEKLDDGALLALCEYYGDEEEESDDPGG